MSSTIKAIECHMTLPVGLGLQSRAANLIAEWQQRGPETFSGRALRKLRLVLEPSQSATFAGAVA